MKTKEHQVTLQELRQQWRAWVKARVDGSDAQIDRAVELALGAMAAGRSQEQIAAVALAAAASPEFAHTARMASTVEQWHQWARRQYGGPDEKIAAVVRAAAQAMAQGMDQATVVRQATDAAEQWNAAPTTAAVRDEEPPAAATEPARGATLAFVGAVACLGLALWIAIVERAFSPLNWLITLGLVVLLMLEPAWTQLKQAPPRVRTLLRAVVGFLAVQQMFSFDFRGTALVVLVAGIAMALAAPVKALIKSPSKAQGGQEEPPAQPDRQESAPVAAPDAAPPEPTPATTGVVAGLMYREVPMLVGSAGNRPQYYPSQVCTFAVRRQGSRSGGRPWPAIQVQWQGWKLEGALEEGDTVTFYEPPQDSAVNTPAALYNASKGERISMAPAQGDPRYQALMATKWFWWVVVAIFVLLWLAVAAFMLGQRH